MPGPSLGLNGKQLLAEVLKAELKFLDEQQNQWRQSIWSSSTCGRQQLLGNWLRVILVSKDVTNSQSGNAPSVTAWRGIFVKFSGAYQAFPLGRKTHAH